MLEGQENPNQELGDLLSIYQNVFLPSFDLLKKSAITHGTRQISNEIRNAHAHLLWGIEPQDNNSTSQHKNAFDHILRATVDALKLVIDSLLARVPPNSQYDVFFEKLNIEKELYRIWDSPAQAQWQDKFSKWCDIINQAIIICEKSYVYDWNIYKELINKIQVEVKVCSDDEVEQFKTSIVAYKKVFQLEKEYRVTFRKRLTDHVVRDLELFHKLLVSIEQSEKHDLYADECQILCGQYQNSLQEYHSNEAMQSLRMLLKDGVIKKDSEFVRVYLGNRSSWSYIEFKEFQYELLQYAKSMNREHAKTVPYEIDDQVSYHSFEVMIQALGEIQLTENQKWNLYYIFCVKQEKEDNPIIYAFFHEFRKRIDLSVNEPIGTLIVNWLGEVNKERLNIHQQESLLSKNRAVWFLDMKGSSKDPAASEKKVKLYQYMISQVTKSKGSHGVVGTPILLNTWGDAIIAVYDDCRLAWQALREIQTFAVSEDIGVRLGASYGLVELKVNPILGVDVVGHTVELAARLEASKDNQGVLISPDFRNQIPNDFDQLKAVKVLLPKHFHGDDLYEAFQF